MKKILIVLFTIITSFAVTADSSIKKFDLTTDPEGHHYAPYTIAIMMPFGNVRSPFSSSFAISDRLGLNMRNYVVGMHTEEGKKKLFIALDELCSEDLKEHEKVQNIKVNGNKIKFKTLCGEQKKNKVLVPAREKDLNSFIKAFEDNQTVKVDLDYLALFYSSGFKHSWASLGKSY